jgi:DNA-binding NarL/FixJ family response regulator
MRRRRGDKSRGSLIVRTADGRYRVSASAVDAGLVHHAPAAVIVAEALDRESPSAPELRDRFGLTPREAQVARLLGRGRRNVEIARELGVTEHTAERHTEHVLRKLGVHSRAAVAAKLREG